MDDLMAKCIDRIQAIIDQLRTDLASLPGDTDTTQIQAAIQKLEEALRLYEK